MYCLGGIISVYETPSMKRHKTTIFKDCRQTLILKRSGQLQSSLSSQAMNRSEIEKCSSCVFSDGSRR